MPIYFYPFQVSTPHIFYACLGGFVVFFGLVSLFIREKLYIGEALLAFIFGVIVGPYGANILNPHDWGGGRKEITDIITLEFTRVVLAIGVFAIGVELPKAYMRKHWKSLAFLLGPIMTWGWFVSAALIYAFVPGLNFVASLAVAACLTPTDPILASAVVGGKWAEKHVPAHLRHLLMAESGCNDGAAFPFLFLALNLLLYKNVGEAIRDWFLFLWLYQIALGIFIGAGIGIGFRHIMKFCQRHGIIDRQSYVAQYLALSMLTVGATTLVGSDDLLACFACGAAFAWDGFYNQQTEEAVFSTVIDLLFNVASFVYVGAWTPFGAFQGPDTPLTVWRLVVIGLLVIVLRRLPIMLVLYKWIPDVRSFREAVFSGHFGPMGIGAVFISTLAMEIIHKDTHENNKSDQVHLLETVIQPIVAFMVLCSVAIHGLSIPMFSLGRRVRTVSRTWSRHAAAPDWTNQAKLVDRGADNIVINRDSVMEQGKLPGGRAVEDTTTLSQSVKEKRVDDEGIVYELDYDTEKGMGQHGDGIITEWQEPHRTVIEQQRGPGEDVQVDVVPSEHVLSGIHHSLHLLDRLKKAVEGRAEQSVGTEIAVIQAHMKELLSTSQPGTDDDKADVVVDDDGEDGWSSDKDAPVADETTAHSRPVHTKRPSSSSSSKSQQIHVVHHHHHHQYQHPRGRSSKRNLKVLAPSPVPEDSQHPLSGTSSPMAMTPTSPTPIYHREGSEADNNARLYQYHRRTASSSASMQPLGSSPFLASRPPTSPSTRPHTAERPSPSSAFYARPATRPSTADGPTSPRLAHSRPGTRPGTADSAYSKRVEHLRTLHSSPPTRDVSPARSIRFKDETIGGTGGKTPPEDDLAYGTTGGSGVAIGTGRFPRTSTT